MSTALDNKTVLLDSTKMEKMNDDVFKTVDESFLDSPSASILYSAGDLLAVRPQAGSDLSERLFVICEALDVVARGCGEFIVRRYDEKTESFGEWQPSVKTTVSENWPACAISLAVRLPGDAIRLNLAEQRRIMDCLSLSDECRSRSDSIDSPATVQNGIDSLDKRTRCLVSIRKDIECVQNLLENIDPDQLLAFCDVLGRSTAARLISGVGKSGIVAQRFAGSLSSVGIASHFVHSTEFVHGDMGKVGDGNCVVVFFSNSGTTSECVAAAHHLVARGCSVLSITSNNDSPLAKLSVVHLCHGKPLHIEPSGGVPTCSIVMQEVIVNAIVTEMIGRLHFTAAEFKSNHPGGALGKKLCSMK